MVAEDKEKERARVFLEVAVGGVPAGRIVCQLYSDKAPLTADNFRALCTGEAGKGENTGKPLSYKGMIFHRVVKDFMIQGGDFTNANGTGGESIYGGTFDDETFEFKHDRPFLLSMANRGKNTNGSQFFITTQPAPHLDNVHVVFGQVISGQALVKQIENLPVDRNSRPLQDVVVTNCGELVKLVKVKKPKKQKRAASASSEASSDEDVKKEKKKKKKKAKKIKKEHRSDEDSGNSSEGEASKNEDEVEHPLVQVTKINPDDIPEVPSNKFLMRGAKNDDKDDKKSRDRDRDGKHSRDKRDRDGGRRARDRPNYTRSGRVIKGRGVFRYRTPSRSRSRSVTPPHWRQAQSRTIKLSDFEKAEEERIHHEEEVKRREAERRKRHEERDKTDTSKPSRESYEKDLGSDKRRHEDEEEDDRTPKNNDPVNVDYNALDYEDQVSDRESKDRDTVSDKKRKLNVEDSNVSAKVSKKAEVRDNGDVHPPERSQMMAMAFGVEPKENNDLLPERKKTTHVRDDKTPEVEKEKDDHPKEKSVSKDEKHSSSKRYSRDRERERSSSKREKSGDKHSPDKSSRDADKNKKESSRRSRSRDRKSKSPRRRSRDRRRSHSRNRRSRSRDRYRRNSPDRRRWVQPFNRRFNRRPFYRRQSRGRSPDRKRRYDRRRSRSSSSSSSDRDRSRRRKDSDSKKDQKRNETPKKAEEQIPETKTENTKPIPDSFDIPTGASLKKLDKKNRRSSSSSSSSSR